jgi:DNA-binding GntR family transcriptional regulator
VPDSAVDGGRSKDRQRLSPQVAKKIRTMIMTGELSGNERLRTEHLADRLGVSATPVREALMSLAGEGFVSFVPGRGFTAVPLTRRDLQDVYDVQAYISGELAARAATELTDDEIAGLWDLQHRIIALVEEGQLEEAQRVDFEWHRTINRASHAPKLTWHLKMTHQYVPFEAYGAIPGWSAAGCQGHIPVMFGLETRNPAGVREAMSAHIRHARDLVLDLLAARGQLAGALPAEPDAAGRDDAHGPTG